MGAVYFLTTGWQKKCGLIHVSVRFDGFYQTLDFKNEKLKQELNPQLKDTKSCLIIPCSLHTILVVKKGLSISETHFPLALYSGGKKSVFVA